MQNSNRGFSAQPLPRMSDNFDLISKACLLCVAMLVVIVLFPVEHPGSAAWQGVWTHWIFRREFLKFTIPDMLAIAVFTLGYLYNSSKPPSVRNRNYFSCLGLISLLILAGYIATFASGGGLSSRTLGVSLWRYIVEGIFFGLGLMWVVDTERKFYKVLGWGSVLIILLTGFALFNFAIGTGVGARVLGKVVFWENPKLKLMVFFVVIIFGMYFLEVGKEKFHIPRWMLFLASFQSLLCIILSGRRNSLVATLIGMSVIFFMAFRRKKANKTVTYMFLGFIAISVLAIWNWDAFSKRFLSRITSVASVVTGELAEEDTVKGDLNDFKIGWAQVKKNPIIGVGFGRQGDKYTKKRFEDSGQNISITWVHNGILTTWITYGFIGMVCYLLIYFSIFKRQRRYARYFSDPVITLFGTYFVILAIMELFFPPYYIRFKDCMVFFGPLGLSASYINILVRKKGQNEG
jgi:hypothetical protein